MTTPEPTESTLENEAAAEASNEEATSSPAPPEPMTPERVTAWNRYLDRYVAGGVLLLVLIASIHPIDSATIWPLLKSGQLITQQGPLTQDPFSYTMEGKTWVNIPWLFEVVNWLAYDLSHRAFSTDPFRADQIAAGVLVGLNAMVLGLTALLLFAVRHRGPGLWWVAVCVMLALGGIVIPSNASGLTLVVGGIAGRQLVPSPETWGIALLAIEILLLHWASNLGRRGALFALPVVFLLWANIDTSFLFGLFVLAAWIIGDTLRPARTRNRPDGEADRKITWTLGLAVLAASVVACVLNPSLHRVFAVAAEPYIHIVRPPEVLTQDQLSFFSTRSQEYFNRIGGPGAARVQVAYYLIAVWIGLISFGLNRKRFSLGRFLVYVLASLLWAGMIVLAPFFGVVFATVLGLNGQEWYLDRFGTEGRLGRGWKLWSDGGRAVTILITLAFILEAVTGYASVTGEPPFGFGAETDQFAFEAADALRESGIQGKVLNLTLAHGDALIWRDPKHKTFIDSRKGLFPNSLRQTLQELRGALSKDDRNRWEPIIKEYGITTVMVSPSQDRPVYEGLSRSPHWLAFYDDGNAVLFGRVDSASPDSTIVKERRLDAGDIVYHRQQSIPVPERPPSPMTWMDQILRSRALKLPQPHVAAAQRWLTPPEEASLSTDGTLDPARCFMAIREARTALARNPDDTYAFRILQTAYLALTQSETSIINRRLSDQSGPKERFALRSAQGAAALNYLAPNTPPLNIPDAFSRIQAQFLAEMQAETMEPAPSESETSPDYSQYLTFRYRQRIAALNYAIQTTPPPNTLDARRELASLNVELSMLHQSRQAFDLERDRLQAARNLLPASEFPEELRQRLAQLNESIEQFQQQLADFAAAQSAGPVERAQLAQQNGFPGIAIEELLAAESSGVSMAAVRWRLVDLYCQIGQPDEAYNLLDTTNVNDPSLATGPGTAAYRQGLVSFLLGFYGNAAFFWQLHALPQLQATQSVQALSAVRGFLFGDAEGLTRSTLELTGSPGARGLVQTEAMWESDLAFCLLESGLPQDVVDEKGKVLQEGAVTHFRKALKLDPRMPIRPLIAYYLEKLGAEVPPMPEPKTPAESTAPAESTPTEKAAEPATAPVEEAPKPSTEEVAPKPAPDSETKDKAEPEPRQPVSEPSKSDTAKPATDESVSGKPEPKR